MLNARKIQEFVIFISRSFLQYPREAFFLFIYEYNISMFREAPPIVFGHQASIEMQEMALTVEFRGHLGGKLIFLYLV